MGEEQKSIDLSASRNTVRVMLVFAKQSTANPLKHALMALGFEKFEICTSYIIAANKKIGDNAIMFFDADNPTSGMEPVDCLKQFREKNPNAIAVPVVENASGQGAYELLQAGAATFLVPPFTGDTLEEILIRASSGGGVKEEFLKGGESHEDLAKLLLDNLDRLVESMREIKTAGGSQKSLLQTQEAFEDAGKTVNMIFGDQPDEFLETLTDLAIERSKMVKTRLGRTRELLRQQRAQEGGDEN